jgi:hypothetical protein
MAMGNALQRQKAPKHDRSIYMVCLEKLDVDDSVFAPN